MNAIAICWPTGSTRRLSSIALSGRIPIHCHPRNAKIPGARLSLVSPSGEILLKCQVASIKESTSVRLANGKVKNGHVLIAKKSTISYKKGKSLGRIGLKWYAVGQMRYYDSSTLRPVIVGDARAVRTTGRYLEESPHQRIAADWTFAAIDMTRKLTRNAEEAYLVRRYIRWVGSEQHFLTGESTKHGGFIDLLNRTTWTLIEAKAHTSDRCIREAFGQLHDYRRSFNRKPRLAVLLPAKPSLRTLNFLTECGVTTIWQLASGGFTDSARGRLSAELRKAYARMQP